MEEYNHKQFLDWLSTVEEKTVSKLLVEAKLSKYWKARASRRAKNASRPWPNKTDREWALAEQGKSLKINSNIHALFEKEIELSEEALNEIDVVLNAIKKRRDEIRLKHEARLLKPQERIKKKKSLSVPMKPEYGGVKKGFDKKVKKLKKKGVAAVAPGESFGPMIEEGE